jgi:hypothetical protein
LPKPSEAKSLLEARGFSLVVLSLPVEVHRARLQKRLREEGYIPKDVERCVSPGGMADGDLPEGPFRRLPNPSPWEADYRPNRGTWIKR